MSTSDFIAFVNKYGFPIVFSGCLAALIWYIWNWVTKDVKPVISQANDMLIDLIDRIRLLDNDLIRLNQKVETVMELRGEPVDHTSNEFEDLPSSDLSNEGKNA